MNDRYTSGQYLNDNPDWHEQDSVWKAQMIERMLIRHNLSMTRICEVGCGTGLILATLQTKLNGSAEFFGYDISPQAIERAQKRSNEHLHFYCKDIRQEAGLLFDLLLLMDVIEHLEDPYQFLRDLQSLSKHTLLHIPLDLSVQSIMRVRPILKQRSTVGHLQYFTKETALALLDDVGYEVVDWFYTGAAMEGKSYSILSWLARIPRRILFALNQDWAVRWLGGYSLMILVRPKK